MLTPKKVLKGTFWKNPTHTNLNIPWNRNWVKIWCVLLDQRIQGQWIGFTSSIELMSSFPFSPFAKSIPMPNNRAITFELNMYCWDYIRLLLTGWYWTHYIFYLGRTAVTEILNYTAFCRTATATPGLLITLFVLISLHSVYQRLGSITCVY